MVYTIIGCCILIALLLIDDIWVSIRNVDLENNYYIDHSVRFKPDAAGVIQRIVAVRRNKRKKYNTKEELTEPNTDEEKPNDVSTMSSKPTSLHDRLNSAKQYHKYYGDLGDKLRNNRLHNTQDFVEYVSSVSTKIYDVNLQEFKEVKSINRVGKDALVIKFTNGSSSSFVPDRYAMVPKEED